MEVFDYHATNPMGTWNPLPPDIYNGDPDAPTWTGHPLPWSYRPAYATTLPRPLGVRRPALQPAHQIPLRLTD